MKKKLIAGLKQLFGGRPNKTRKSVMANKVLELEIINIIKEKDIQIASKNLLTLIILLSIENKETKKSAAINLVASIYRELCSL